MTTFCSKCSQPLLGGSPLCSNCGYDNAAGAFVEKPGGTHQASARRHDVHAEHAQFSTMPVVEESKWGGRVLIGVIVLSVLGILGYGFWSWNKSRVATTISW